MKKAGAKGVKCDDKKIKHPAVLLGIIIFVGILVYLVPFIVAGLDSDTSIQSCIEGEIENVVEKVSLQGGSLNPEQYVLYENEKVEYLCHTDNYYETCSIRQPMLMSHIESEIRNEISEKVIGCYEKQGAVNSDSEIKVEILPEKIIVEGDSFKVVLNSSIYDFLSITDSILNFETKYGDSETTIYMNAYHEIKVEKKKLSDGTTVYILTNRDSEDKFQFASRSLAFPVGLGIKNINKINKPKELGTCIDPNSGTCVGNTLKDICVKNKGDWKTEEPGQVPECSLGCCVMGEDTDYTTQKKCFKTSKDNGFKWVSWVNTGSESQCLSLANAEGVVGACVTDNGCENTIENKCGFKDKFYRDYLCSAEKLNTNCTPTDKTTCVNGKDGVYFLDSCGNTANIYDASKINDKDYWEKVVSTLDSCENGLSNTNSKTCGNCDYFRGSSCKKSDGNSYCSDLSCEYNGARYKNGETWCGSSSNFDEKIRGERDFRLACYSGEVTVEPCADFKQETCTESEINGFKSAVCKVNKWQDCILQGSQKSCESAKRDCSWINEKCVPEIAPAFDFWNVNGDGEILCSVANAQCLVEYDYGSNGNKVCVKNCECLEDSWANELNQYCGAIGDCVGQKNIIG